MADADDTVGRRNGSRPAASVEVSGVQVALLAVDAWRQHVTARLADGIAENDGLVRGLCVPGRVTCRRWQRVVCGRALGAPDRR